MQGPHVAERVGRMAAPAVRSEFVIVNVVRAMAASAVAIYDFDPVQRCAMTGFTLNLCVRTLDWKVRLHIVIECPEFPSHRVVASIAACREVPPVRVVIAVTRAAVIVYVDEGRSLVTVAALRSAVKAQKRKAGQVVIEENRILPINFGVAGFA